MNGKKTKEGLGLLFDGRGWRLIQPTALRSLLEEPVTQADLGTHSACGSDTYCQLAWDPGAKPTGTNDSFTVKTALTSA